MKLKLRILGLALLAALACGAVYASAEAFTEGFGAVQVNSESGLALGSLCIASLLAVSLLTVRRARHHLLRGLNNPFYVPLNERRAAVFTQRRFTPRSDSPTAATRNAHFNPKAKDDRIALNTHPAMAC
jgi:hypothetical protein